ncbi:MAG: DUF169 domain-containing protein [Dehalococcoidales bacterium]|nr:DUF169 domain-containing protein [Dehalococcoidales bacterium]
MTTLKEYNKWGEELEKLLVLRTSPLAVKMLEKEADIPEGAIRPKRDYGYHISQCQAFAMSRRGRKATIAMLKEDNWCPAPVSAYGLALPREEVAGFPYMVENKEAAEKLNETSPEFEYGKYKGIVSAPLKTANFEPDLAMIYSNTAQLRHMLLAVKYKEGLLVTSQFDPLRSCVFAVIPVIQNGCFRITLPDTGEQYRTMSGEDEIIFSVPRDKIEEVVLGLRHFEEMTQDNVHRYSHLDFDYRPDFPQPKGYEKMFKQWGMDVLK